MAEPIKISTSKYTKEGKVEIDGHLWTVKLPGAGTELRLSQAFRGSKLWSARINSMDKKIDAGTSTDADLDKYEEYNNKYNENEKIIFDFFSQMFQDGTEDNSEVKAWVENTPTSIIQQTFEDIKEQNDNNAKATDGQTEPSESK